MTARQIHHWANLGMGLQCPCPKPRLHVTRLQSTRCKQKQWGQLIHDAGPELLFALASGHICIVHDVDAKLQESRACWQGLSFLRYACWKAWNPEIPPPLETSRVKQPLNGYWEQEWRKLPRSTRRWLRYFKQYHKPGTGLYLRSCWTRGGGRLAAMSSSGIQLLGEVTHDIRRIATDGDNNEAPTYAG